MSCNKTKDVRILQEEVVSKTFIITKPVGNAFTLTWFVMMLTIHDVREKCAVDTELHLNFSFVVMIERWHSHVHLYRFYQQRTKLTQDLLHPNVDFCCCCKQNRPSKHEN